ncbi:hypothetical protein VPH35_023833 [Triticum aestivum]|uniref:proline-rich receptor-like protein kinase PERK9 n=1 Tax=Triticum aestivum TaxID=4565 RepID=UPI001D011C7B|nr:proline-rich receptor-like protein kinase PERK9 [Triticum aestivum]
MNPEAAKAGTLELLCLVLIWPSAPCSGSGQKPCLRPDSDCVAFATCAIPQRFGRSRVAHSRFFLCSRLALTARGHMPRPTTSSHCLAPPPPLLSLLPPLPASQGTLPLPPPFAAGECAATGVWPAATAAAVPRPEKPRAGRCGGRRPAASSFGRPPLRRRETAMAARCPSAAGQGSAGVQTPSTPSPSRQRPTPSPIQRPRHPSGPAPQLCSPSASAASHPKQRRGAPYHEPLQPRQTSRPTPPPSHFPPSFFSAGTHHPFLGFCGKPAASCGPCPAVEKANG